MVEDADPAAMLEQADRVQVRIRREGRWYPGMMTAFGLVTIGIVASVPMLDSDWAGIAFGAIVVVLAIGMVWWKSRHPVRPISRRDSQKWIIAWIVLYIAVVSWFGPTFVDHAVGWWALLGVVVAIPPFVEAGRAWQRVRR